MFKDWWSRGHHRIEPAVARFGLAHAMPSGKPTTLNPISQDVGPKVWRTIWFDMFDYKAVRIHMAWLYILQLWGV